MPSNGPIFGWAIAVDRVIDGRKGSQSYAVGIPDKDLALSAMRREVGGEFPLRAVDNFDAEHAASIGLAAGEIKQMLTIKTGRLN